MTVEFSRDELRALNNALNEVLHGPDAIEEWEFGTRMGVTREEACSFSTGSTSVSIETR